MGGTREGNPEWTPEGGKAFRQKVMNCSENRGKI